MKQYLFVFLCYNIAFTACGQDNSGRGMAKPMAPTGTERRLALVVGNKDYIRPDARLQNPLNDANDMAATLEALGFDVIKRTELTLSNFKKVVDEFGTRLANYDVALFYYSGHGVQFNGENYLVPIDATLQTLSDAEDDCLRLGRVMGKMKAANIKNNLVFLDACRNNPFHTTRGTAHKGLIIPNNPAGSIVVFATEEGSTADDNVIDRNGLFTSELLRHLPIPNLSLSDIVLRTRQGVYERSGQTQLPSDYNKMLGVYYFIKHDQQLLEKDYKRLLQDAILEINKNNRTGAIELFQKAQMIASENGFHDVLTTQWYENILAKAGRYFQYEEYATALDWYKVAQAINNNNDIKNKINECKAKL